MNFFGHAATAAAHDASPRFVLGAMLPDLANMARTRLAAPDDAEVARGVRFHHVTDGVFHRHPTFTAACSLALTELSAVGVQRGPARAVAHVGYELLLDGAIAGDDRGLAAYHDALAAGQELAAGGRDGLDALAPLAPMLRRLAAAPVPHAYGDAAFVAARLHDILGRRPRLALSPDDHGAVGRWCQDARAPIHQGARALAAEVTNAATQAFLRD